MKCLQDICKNFRGTLNALVLNALWKALGGRHTCKYCARTRNQSRRCSLISDNAPFSKLCHGFDSHSGAAVFDFNNVGLFKQRGRVKLV